MLQQWLVVHDSSPALRSQSLLTEATTILFDGLNTLLWIVFLNSVT